VAGAPPAPPAGARGPKTGRRSKRAPAAEDPVRIGGRTPWASGWKRSGVRAPARPTAAQRQTAAVRPRRDRRGPTPDAAPSLETRGGPAPSVRERAAEGVPARIVAWPWVSDRSGGPAFGVAPESFRRDSLPHVGTGCGAPSSWEDPVAARLGFRPAAIPRLESNPSRRNRFARRIGVPRWGAPRCGDPTSPFSKQGTRRRVPWVSTDRDRRLRRPSAPRRR